MKIHLGTRDMVKGILGKMDERQKNNSEKLKILLRCVEISEEVRTGDSVKIIGEKENVD